LPSFDGETVADKGILDRWETWLALHEAASRLQGFMGQSELATLWYGGLRDTVWNRASPIFNSCGARTTFISIIMFHWVAENCQLLGDE
jgi:hypothetical protein